MKTYPVIIVGGGPAGASCAWHLGRGGVQALVLDKQNFPRPKTCAGWITPQVLADVQLDPGQYPHTLSVYPALKIWVKGIPIRLPGRQYAVRRIEFDDWLLKRSEAVFLVHEVKNIRRQGEFWIVDEQFRSRYLIGAGGTHCPVYHQLFKDTHPRSGTRIAALEAEFPYSWKDEVPRLRFLDRGLPGYSWYLPKRDGVLNIGVGGNAAVMKKRGDSIHTHWNYLLDYLGEQGLFTDAAPQPEGYVYHLWDDNQLVSQHQVMLVGDAAGLATLDMGEGIGPAVKSGSRAAESILQKTEYSLTGLEKYSLIPEWLGKWIIRS